MGAILAILLAHPLCSKPLPFDFKEHACPGVACYVSSSVYLLSFVSIMLLIRHSTVLHPFLNSMEVQAPPARPGISPWTHGHSRRPFSGMIHLITFRRECCADS